MAGKINNQIKDNGFRNLKLRLKRLNRVQNLYKSISNTIGSILLILILIIIQILVNQVFDLPSSARTFMFWGSVVIALIHFIGFVLFPLIKRLFESESKKLLRANGMIHNYFEEINDRLLNTIELAEGTFSNEQRELVDASIKARIEWLGKFSFKKALNVKGFIKAIIIGIGFILIVLITKSINPNIALKGYARTVNYKLEIGEIEKYGFELEGEDLKTLTGNDFLLKANLTFDNEEEPVYIEIGNHRRETTVEGRTLSYLIETPNRSLDFKLVYKNFESESYHLEVVPKIEIESIEIKVYPPEYTALKHFVLNETGSLEVAMGSDVVWNIMMRDSRYTLVTIGEDSISFREDKIRFERHFNRDSEVLLFSEGSMEEDTMRYGFNIKINPDLFPEIIVGQAIDSISTYQVWYQGVANDDYGINEINVVVTDMEHHQIKREAIEIRKNVKNQNFFYNLDIDQFDKDVMVVFEVFDNDEINGSKKTESETFYYRRRGIEEIYAESKKRLDEISNDLNYSTSLIEKMNETLNDLRRNEITDELSDWELSEKMKEFQMLKNELEEMVENIKIQNSIKKEIEDRFLEEEIMKKAEMIQQLFEELMDDEMKSLMAEFEKMLENESMKINEEDTKRLEMSLENMKRKMEMDLELLKRYEVEKDIINQANKLDKMKENVDNEKEINLMKEYEEWQRKLDDILDKNKELMEPFSSGEIKEKAEELKKAIENSGNEKKSNSEKQKDSTHDEVDKKMDELANSLRNMIGMMGEMNSVDLEELRIMVHSLNEISIEHENQIEIINDMSVNHPVFSETMIRERNILQKYNRIKDSLVSYGYRQPLIAKIVGAEMFHVETSFGHMFSYFEDGRAGQVKIEQNKAMEAINSIALKLDEIVKEYENAKPNSQGQQGFTDRKKPQTGEEDIGNMQTKQKGMKEQLKNAIEQMKREGQKGKDGKESMARMLGEREMIRRKIEELSQSGMVGKDAKEKLNEAAKMMEEVEKDIIYNRLSDETYQKDEWISTRLLEAENAERERDKEERRESREAGSTFEKYLGDEIQNDKEYKKRIDEIKYRDIKLKEYFDKVYREYLKKKEVNKK